MLIMIQKTHALVRNVVRIADMKGIES